MFKLTFESVYVYHLVLLIYMGLAQDNTSLTSLRTLLSRREGLLFESSVGAVWGGEKCHHPNNFFFFFFSNSVLPGKAQRGFFHPIPLLSHFSIG